MQEILRSGLNTGKDLHIGGISLGGLQGIFPGEKFLKKGGETLASLACAALEAQSCGRGVICKLVWVQDPWQFRGLRRGWLWGLCY